MTDLPHAAGTDRPTSLVDRAETEAAAMLGIASLRHRSALLRLAPFDGAALVATIHRTIADDYVRGGASANKDLSRENWRWQTLQPRISAHNPSPEVRVERAIAAACQRLGRRDWANQVPTASGLLGSTRDRRRAIDLVRRRGPRHFELIELKIASDTPLYAAVEIIAHACLWLIARTDRPSRPSPLLDADHMDLRVLAPSAYHAPFALTPAEAALDAGIRALGQRHGATLTFAFDRLHERIHPDAIPDDETLLALLDHPPLDQAPGAPAMEPTP